MPPQPQSAYRHKPSPRTLVLELRQDRRLRMVLTFAGVLMVGWAASSWMEHATADIIHVTQGGNGSGTDHDRPYVDHEVVPLTWSLFYDAFLGTGPKIAIHYTGGAKEPMACLLLAAVAFLTPRYMRKSATLVLDEREDRLTIHRVRFGVSDDLVYPLHTLNCAVLVPGTRTSRGQLVFANGERIDVARSVGASETEVLVATVNRFIGHEV